MNYKVIDNDTYYRSVMFRHFTQDCKSSTSITHRVDVTDLLTCSRNNETKFYINSLYVLAKVLNSREDYRLSWRYDTQQLIAYGQINLTQYIVIMFIPLTSDNRISVNTGSPIMVTRCFFIT